VGQVFNLPSARKTPQKQINASSSRPYSPKHARGEPKVGQVFNLPSARKPPQKQNSASLPSLVPSMRGESQKWGRFSTCPAQEKPQINVSASRPSSQTRGESQKSGFQRLARKPPVNASASRPSPSQPSGANQPNQSRAARPNQRPAAITVPRKHQRKPQSGEKPPHQESRIALAPSLLGEREG
jgi:hypothetical protein